MRKSVAKWERERERERIKNIIEIKRLSWSVHVVSVNYDRVPKQIEEARAMGKSGSPRIK